MGYMGMCRCEGYGFQAVYSRIGYTNQSVQVQNRVSFFRKVISWLKILSRLGKQLLQDRGILGVYSSIGQQNSAELALVQVKGSRVPAANPHPEIPKVPPPGPFIIRQILQLLMKSFHIDPAPIVNVIHVFGHQNNIYRENRKHMSAMFRWKNLNVGHSIWIDCRTPGPLNI